jgi:hypothetical protein
MTGNAVFDFRAGFRRTAGFVQKALLLTGAAALLLGGLTWLTVGSSRAAEWELLTGAAVFGGGIAWGFLWRSSLRQSFQKTYGPGS